MNPDRLGRSNAQLITKVILSVFRLNGQLLEEGDELVSSLGLTSARWQVLGALYVHPRTVSQIARSMGLTRQSVQRTANKLEEGKFILFKENPHHLNAPLLTLTPKGLSALDKATELQKEWARDLAQNQSTNDLNTALSVLEKLTYSLMQNEGDDTE